MFKLWQKKYPWKLWVQTLGSVFKGKSIPFFCFVFLSTSIGILVTGAREAISGHLGMDTAHKGGMTLKKTWAPDNVEQHVGSELFTQAFT